MNSSRQDGTGPGQLRLSFPEDGLSFADMCISSANTDAIGIIRALKAWPTAFLCLIGPAESGLSTAANAWAAETDARLISGPALDACSHDEIEAWSNGNIAVDDADTVTSDSNLLFLLNRIESKGSHLLLTARTPPSVWKTGNADLHSRLSAMPIAELLAPDEVLLKARLSAACRRRFVKLPDDVAQYLAMRMERSHTAIEDLARRLDEFIDVSGRKLTIPLARAVLGADNSDD